MNLATTTYYVRDAQGNVMATYDYKPSGVNNTGPQKLSLIENAIYGSSRLGMRTYTDVDNVNGNASPYFTNTSDYTQNLKSGLVSYELSNHLGNVLTVVSDRKIPVDVGNNGTVDYYVADVLAANDYYAFGGQMPSRAFNAGNYRYGFNGKENDNEVKGVGNSLDFEARMYDSRLGKWLSVVLLYKTYVEHSPYRFATNNPILYLDFDGREIKPSRNEAFVYEDDIKNIVGNRAVGDQLSKVPLTIHGLGVTTVNFDSKTDFYYKLNPTSKKYDVMYTTNRFVNKGLQKDGLLDKLNPGLSEEVKEHEQGHVDQFDEVIQKKYTIQSGFTQKQKDPTGKVIKSEEITFTGQIDAILDQAAAFYDKNKGAFTSTKMTKEQYVEGIFQSAKAAIKVEFANRQKPPGPVSDTQPLETDANKRAGETLAKR